MTLLTVSSSRRSSSSRIMMMKDSIVLVVLAVVVCGTMMMMMMTTNVHGFHPTTSSSSTLSSLNDRLQRSFPSSSSSFDVLSTSKSPSRSSSLSSLSLTSLSLSSTVDDDTTTTSTNEVDLPTQIQESLELLYRAAETKSENPDTVVDALLTLEKLQRQQNKLDPTSSDKTLESLSGNDGGSWRLIFTTGTIDTQKKTGRQINYFPVKATQSFKKSDDRSEDWYIENGIYLGDFPVIKFRGDFDWTLQKSGVTKLTFDFTKLQLFGTWDITLKSGEAAGLGAKTGLGSENNVQLVESQGKRAFFNWISADDKIATARGGGGGLALWKRVEYEGDK